jgi:hypothetical protein
MADSTRSKSPNIIDQTEFRGIVGEDLDVFATIWSAEADQQDSDDDESSQPQHPISVPVIVQEDDSILVFLYNYSGILRITKGGPNKSELNLSFGAMKLPSTNEEAKANAKRSSSSRSSFSGLVDAGSQSSSVYLDAYCDEKSNSSLGGGTSTSNTPVRVQNFYTGEISYTTTPTSKNRGSKTRGSPTTTPNENGVSSTQNQNGNNNNSNNNQQSPKQFPKSDNYSPKRSLQQEASNCPSPSPRRQMNEDGSGKSPRKGSWTHPSPAIKEMQFELSDEEEDDNNHNDNNNGSPKRSPRQQINGDGSGRSPRKVSWKHRSPKNFHAEPFETCDEEDEGYNNHDVDPLNSSSTPKVQSPKQGQQQSTRISQNSQSPKQEQQGPSQTHDEDNLKPKKFSDLKSPRKQVVLRMVPSIIPESSERSETEGSETIDDLDKADYCNSHGDHEEPLAPPAPASTFRALRSLSILKKKSTIVTAPPPPKLPMELPFADNLFGDESSMDSSISEKKAASKRDGNWLQKDQQRPQPSKKTDMGFDTSIGFEDLEMISRRFGQPTGQQPKVVDRDSASREGKKEDDAPGASGRAFDYRPQSTSAQEPSLDFNRMQAKFSQSTVDRFNSSTVSQYEDWDKEESSYASPLHEACDSPFPTLSALQSILTEYPRAVKKRDDQGRLPLHILVSNQELIFEGGEVGRETATEIARQMMDLYPEAVYVEDDDGRVPFTLPIIRWIDWTYSNDFANMPPAGNFSSNATTFASRLASSWGLGSGSGSGGSRRATSAADTKAKADSDKLAKDEDALWTRFPAAEITEDVEWCFEMLSLALDSSGGKTAGGIGRPQLSYKKQLQDRKKLVTNVASIPLLLKTVLLLESNDARKRILRSPIIRRVFLCPEALGEWLTAMLITPPVASRLAVTYLEVISDVTVQDFIGDFRKATPADTEDFKVARKLVYDELFELGGVIPALVVLNEKYIERAASTKAVYFLMSASLTQPLVVALVVTDFVMQITLMLAFRSTIIMPEVAVLTENLAIPGIHVIFSICSYLLFRQAVDLIALGRVSRKVLKRHVFDLW